MIPVIYKAKKWLMEVCRPWLPPKGLWQELLVFEMYAFSADILFNLELRRCYLQEGC